MSLKKEQAEQTRQELLSAALKVFCENGFNATRLEDIAREANVTRGALYWHFKNKIDIYLAVFDETFKIVTQNFRRILNYDNMSPIEKIRTVIIDFGKKFVEDDYYRSIGVLQYNIEKTREVRAAMGKRVKAKHHADGSLLVSIIDASKECGEIPEQIDTQLIKQNIMTFIMGMIMGLIDDFKPLKSDMIEPMTDLFLESIRK
jgi:AcrR family transcriptional regulator